MLLILWGLLSFLDQVRLIDDLDGKSFCFELYSESSSVVKGCKTDSKGTVVQGNHKAYRYVYICVIYRMDNSGWVPFPPVLVCMYARTSLFP